MTSESEKRRTLYWITPDRFSLKPDKSTWLEMTRALNNLKRWHVRIVAARSSAEHDEQYQQEVEFVSALDAPFIFRLSTLLSILILLRRRTTPEDVIVLNPDSLWLVPLLRLFCGCPIVLDIRTLPVDVHGLKGRLDWLLFWHLPMRLYCRRVDGYSFITERLRSEVESEFGIRFPFNAVWQSGVNLDAFGAPDYRVRKPEAPIRFFYHGSISLKRGLGTLVSAVGDGEFQFPVELEVVGDGPDLHQIKRVASESRYSDRIRFSGFVPYEDVVQRIQRADVCICPLPDRIEWNVSSPLKVFEYMSCCRPMILTPIPAHRDILADAPYVVWTHGHDTEAFIRALSEAHERIESIQQEAERARGWITSLGCEWKDQAAKLDRYLTRISSPADQAVITSPS